MYKEVNLIEKFKIVWGKKYLLAIFLPILFIIFTGSVISEEYKNFLRIKDALPLNVIVYSFLSLLTYGEVIFLTTIFYKK